MAIASTLFFVYDKLLKKIVPEKIYQSKAFVGLLLLGIIALTPVKDTVAMLQSEKHGKVVPHELSHWYFTNWKQASLPIKNEIKDIILDQYYYQEGVYQNKVALDNTILEAVKLLKNKTKYNQILAGNK